MWPSAAREATYEPRSQEGGRGEKCSSGFPKDGKTVSGSMDAEGTNREDSHCREWG
jgi:hypothetical protein